MQEKNACKKLINQKSGSPMVTIAVMIKNSFTITVINHVVRNLSTFKVIL